MKIKEADYNYCTFPICLLGGDIQNLSLRIQDILAFCFFDQVNRLEGAFAERVEFVAKKLNIQIGERESTYRKGEILYNEIEPKSPITSLRRDMLLEFCYSKKTEFEKESLLAFAAIKSILGRKALMRIYNEFFIARIAGNRNTSQPLSDWVERKYIKNGKPNRYQINKLKNELVNNWGLKIYGFECRGFFVSIKLDMEKLICYVEVNKAQKKQKAKNKLIKEIREEVRKRLK